MSTPLFSIIIATYNRSKYLPKTIESILAQTYSDFELLIIDDGSTDDTRTVVEPFLHDSRISYEALSQNKGATYARNYGLTKTKGEWILLWDSDDMLYPHALETISVFSRKYTHASIFSAPAKAIRKGKEEQYPVLHTGLLTLSDIVCRRLPQNSKVRFAKKFLFDQVRYVSKNIDFLVNVGLAERGTWFHINEPLGELRIEDDTVSLTSHRKKFKKALSIERSFFLIDFLNRYKDILTQSAPELYAAYCYGASVGQFFAKEYKTARFLALQSMTNSFSLKAFGIYFFSTIASVFSKK